MDQSALLSTARAEFLRNFTEAMQRAVPRCIEDFFVKADDSYSSLEQGRLLDARSVLVEQGALVVQKMTQSMDHLLARSFQTTYSTYRPSANFNTDNLTLIDPTAFEGGLKIEEITARFRGEAEEQLRDLNIRIALIFEQEVTNERENPFRPYLFSRCIASTIENLNIDPNLVDVLIERFSDNFIGFVPAIYASVNSILAKNGIAAQLQLKIRKSPTSQGEHSDHFDQVAQGDETDLGDASVEQNDASASKSMPQTQTLSQPRRQQHGSQIEQFFSNALNRAANLVGMRPEQVDAETVNTPMREYGTPMLESGEPENFQSSAFSWVKSGEAVGDAIRNFFGTGSSSKEMHVIQDSSGQNNIPVDTFDQTRGTLAHGSRSTESTYPVAERHSSLSSSGLAQDAKASTNSNFTHSPNGVHTGGGASTPGELARSLHGFQQAYTPTGDEMFDGSGGLRNLILEQRGALTELASNVDEQMTIDIVAMLFEFILRDTQVPAEIRAQLGRLQFLVLKLALKDSSLLTEKGHPARLLVNRIGSISLGLKQIDPSGVEITKEICRIVEALLQDESENPQLFSLMLDEFDAFIARELRAVDKKTEHAIEGAELARNRTLRFAHTAAQLHEALLGLTIDPFLQHFFESVWVYALELADREDAKRAHRYRLLVPDLLWSIVPKSSEEERMQLLALLPIILATLREGIASINWEAEQKEALMNWLVDAHTKALRINHSATIQKAPSLSTIHNHFNSFFSDPDLENFTPLRTGAGSGVRKFLDDAIQELDIKVQLLDQIYVEELPREDVEKEEKAADGGIDFVMQQLKTGVAVEINLGGEPGHGRLNWIDPALTNLILTLEGQEQPSMVSVRMFRRMIAHGRVKFLETEPLFERAVQSLLKSADSVEQPKS